MDVRMEDLFTFDREERKTVDVHQAETDEKHALVRRW